MEGKLISLVPNFVFQGSGLKSKKWTGEKPSPHLHIINNLYATSNL